MALKIEKIKCHNKKQKKGDFVRKSGCIGAKHVLLNAMKLEYMDCNWNPWRMIIKTEKYCFILFCHSSVPSFISLSSHTSLFSSVSFLSF